MERKEALRRVPFLKTLPEGVIAAIAAAGKERSLKNGTLLFTEGAPCLGLIVVLTGAMRIYKTDNRGRELTLGLEEPGASVAELPLFDGGNYPASAEAAEEETAVLVVTRDQFQKLMETYPEIAVQSLRALATRMRKQVQIIEAQALHTVRARLADYLLHTAKGRITFPLVETNDAIGTQIGTVREVVSRTLGNLREAGAIALRGRWVTIQDDESLRRIADAEEPRNS